MDVDSPKVVTTLRSSRTRSLTVPRSYGASADIYDIAVDDSPRNSTVALESTRNEGSVNASTVALASTRSIPRPSGFELKALEEQRLMHKKEASDIIQAIAASNEHHTAQVTAQKEWETNGRIAMVAQSRDAQVSHVHHSAEKMTEEAGRLAAEAERYSQELAQSSQMLQIQASQKDIQVTMQSAESQSAKQISLQTVAENDRLQKQVTDMQRLLESQLENVGQDQANPLPCSPARDKKSWTSL